jgi:hypothetical protein
MFDDVDHEVIDSPAALLRHLYEEHHVAEARDLDPATAPVQFWLRRHAELERAATLQAARAIVQGGPPSPPEAGGPPARPGRAEEATRPEGGGRQAADATPGRGSGGFADPLVEAVAVALARRGLDERRVRSWIRGYRGRDGRLRGEDGVRAEFIRPLLDALAGRVAGAAAPPRPGAGERGQARPAAAAAGADDDLMAIADALQRPGGGRGGRGRPAQARAPADDDVMALANAVQRRHAR